VRAARGMKLAVAVVAGVIALSVTACSTSKNVSGGDDDEGSGKGLKVGLAYDIGGRGDKSFNDAAAAGLERVKKELKGSVGQVKELEANKDETEKDKAERLKLLCKGGYNPVIAVGFVYAGNDPATGPLATAAKECPDTKFGIIDDGTATADNIANLVFAEEQGSFLVGVAAALKSKTKNVGFVGGCQVPLIKKFEAGYTAGVKAADPAAKVQVKYLSTPAQKCSGFNDPAAGKTAAEGQYDGGADIVYQAAGGSGGGVFQAAQAKKKLAIGVDSDQYNTADPAVRDVIITSMLKRVDVAVFNFVKDVSDDAFKAGPTVFDLKSDGVGYSTSGGQIDDIKSKLEDYKQQIIDGKIQVPST
jgi:basic membrane protein A